MLEKKIYMDDTEYLKERLQDQIDWYDKKSSGNKKMYYYVRLIEVLAASSIPFVILFSAKENEIVRIIVAGIGVLLAVVAGFMSIFKFQEKWIEYRTICESLRHHKYRYLTRTKPYDDGNSFNEFVNNVEALISKENTNWAQYIRGDENESKK